MPDDDWARYTWKMKSGDSNAEVTGETEINQNDHHCSLINIETPHLRNSEEPRLKSIIRLPRDRLNHSNNTRTTSENTNIQDGVTHTCEKPVKCVRFADTVQSPECKRKWRLFPFAAVLMCLAAVIRLLWSPVWAHYICQSIYHTLG